MSTRTIQKQVANILFVDVKFTRMHILRIQPWKQANVRKQIFFDIKLYNTKIVNLFVRIYLKVLQPYINFKEFIFIFTQSWNVKNFKIFYVIDIFLFF